MKEHFFSQFQRLLREQKGQAIPWIVVTMILFLGMAGFSVDLGRAYVVKRMLQDTTDAAALAGAQALPNTNAATQATTYSSLTGDSNANPLMGTVSMVSGYPKASCLTSLVSAGLTCLAPANANAVQVKQQAIINTYFLRILGKNTLTVTASATASMRGASNIPYNVAIILDGTPSMVSYDSDCGATQYQCALNGVQILLQQMSPCPASLASCNIANGVSQNAVDTVSLFTFPNTDLTSATNAITCQEGGGFTGYGYTTPTYTATTYTPMASSYTAGSGRSKSTVYGNASYQVVPWPSSTGNTQYVSDYRTSDTTTALNPNSAIVKLSGAASGCSGMGPVTSATNQNTYYAGAIYAATATLGYQKSLNTSSQNVVILLTDGNANSAKFYTNPGSNGDTYPSSIDTCGQGIKAAKWAVSSGGVDRFYTVSYGSPTTSYFANHSSGGCPTDSSGTYYHVDPCTAMADMASKPAYFYSDAFQGSTCASASQPINGIKQIFTSIANDLTTARLIPDGTT